MRRYTSVLALALAAALPSLATSADLERSQKDLHGSYVTYGRAFGRLLPYVISTLEDDGGIEADQVPTLGVLALLSAGVSPSTVSADTDSYGIGVRYQLPAFSSVKGALVHVQYDRIDTDGGPGNLNFSLPGVRHTVDVIGVSFTILF
jgi:hypothetical protein